MEIFSVLLFSTEICKYFHPSIFMGHILNSIFSSLLLTNLSYKMELLKQIRLLSESLQHLPQFGCCKPADNLHFCRVHMIWFKSGAPPKDSFHGRCAPGGRHQGSQSLSLLDSLAQMKATPPSCWEPECAVSLRLHRVLCVLAKRKRNLQYLQNFNTLMEHLLRFSKNSQSLT